MKQSELRKYWAIYKQVLKEEHKKALELWGRQNKLSLDARRKALAERQAAYDEEYEVALKEFKSQTLFSRLFIADIPEPIRLFAYDVPPSPGCIPPSPSKPNLIEFYEFLLDGKLDIRPKQ